MLECEIAETCLPPVALPKAHQTNVSSNSAYSDWANVWNRRRLDSFPTDSLGGSRASSNSGLKKLGGPGAAPLNWTPGPIVELVDSSRARNGVSWRRNGKRALYIRENEHREIEKKRTATI